MESLPAMTLAPPPPSNVVSKMASMSRQPGPSQARAVLRSSGFSEPPPQCPKRDEDLALIEEFELGPKEHTAPFTDPNFDRVEPNSGIRLSYVIFTPAYHELNTCVGHVSCHTTIYKTIFVAGIIYRHLVYIPASAYYPTSKDTMSQWMGTG